MTSNSLMILKKRTWSRFNDPERTIFATSILAHYLIIFPDKADFWLLDYFDYFSPQGRLFPPALNVICVNYKREATPQLWNVWLVPPQKYFPRKADCFPHIIIILIIIFPASTEYSWLFWLFWLFDYFSPQSRLFPRKSWIPLITLSPFPRVLMALLCTDKKIMTFIMKMCHLLLKMKIDKKLPFANCSKHDKFLLQYVGTLFVFFLLEFYQGLK